MRTPRTRGIRALRAGRLAALALCLALMAACGGNDTRGSGGEGGKRTLLLWDYFSTPGQIKGMEDLIAAFEDANPDIDVQRKAIPDTDLERALLQAAASGTLPDVTIVDNVSSQALAASGVLTDLTARVDAWGQRDQYYPGPWNSNVYKSKVYGIPNNSNCLALYYNKKLLGEAGVTPPTTWQGLRDAAKKLTKGDTRGFGMSAVKGEEGTFQLLPFLWQSGGDMDTFANHGARALSFLDSLLDDGTMSKAVVGWSQQDLNAQFESGNVAMQINGPWEVASLKEAEGRGLEWGVGPLPKDVIAASDLGGENWGIPSGSKNPDDAWKLIQFSQQPDQLLKFLTSYGGLPQRKDIADDGPWVNDPALSVFAKEIAIARPRAYGPKYPQISAAVSTALQATLTSQATPQDAAKTAADAITPLLGQ